jgi:hypothetical protein
MLFIFMTIYIHVFLAEKYSNILTKNKTLSSSYVIHNISKNIILSSIYYIILYYIILYYMTTFASAWLHQASWESEGSGNI